MMIKLVVIICLAGITTSNSEAPVAFGYHVGYGYALPASSPSVNIFPALPAMFVALEPVERTPDPAITAAHATHKAFLEKQHVQPPYRYSYGYEAHDSRTGTTTSQYESRYGDVAVGTYTSRTLDTSRSVVDYTVDSRHGFHAVVRKDVQGRAVSSGYGRLGGSLAYASRRAPDEYATRTTLLADPGVVEDPLIQSAFRTHRITVEYLGLTAPFNVSWGYDVTDAVAGRRSQYETYHGDTAQGSYAVVEPDGTQRRVDYTVTPKGYAFTHLITKD